MKLTIRSKILVLIGTAIYGDPQKSNMKLSCSSEEFYGYPSERPSSNQQSFHPSVGGNDANMIRAGVIDWGRRKAFKHMCILMCIFSASVQLAGTVVTAGVVKTKSVVSSVSNKIENKQALTKRAEQIKDEAKTLTDQANAGKVSKEEYEARAKALQEEFKHIQEQL